ncbi:hypothetical protein [Marinomonas mediterranea]|uniref:hypothetical protein n=1 Tax=Marinomonas mediterranea TaxID=119864 RepID=UPI00234AA3A3|nr:hypothetical protein [Marinomonas mediterranea]WCN09365.1 hypothetical protein GV055_10705 [Marinomonas mediterranea]
MSIFFYFLLGFLVFQYHRLSLFSLPVLWSGLIIIQMMSEDVYPVSSMVLHGCLVLVVCNAVLFAKQVNQKHLNVESIALALTGCVLGGVIAGQIIGLTSYNMAMLTIVTCVYCLFYVLTSSFKARLEAFRHPLEKTLVGSLIANMVYGLTLFDMTMATKSRQDHYSLLDHLKSLFLFLGMGVGLIILPVDNTFNVTLSALMPIIASLMGVIVSSFIKLELKSKADRVVMDVSAMCFCFSVLLKDATFLSSDFSLWAIFS